jgi:subfamily B ATP-binding cassette protein MsbA
MNDLKQIISLVRILKPYPWAIPTIIVLGTLSSLCEGLGISLFIPFIKGFGQTTNQLVGGNFLLDFINELFINIPVNSRAIVIPLCIFGTVLLKNILLYSNTLLSCWIYLHLVERLISRMFNQLLTVSYSFLESQPSGKLLNTLHTETWQACSAWRTLFNILVNISTIFVFITLLLLISWQLTVGVAIALTLISVVVQRVTKSAKKLGLQVVQANDNLAQRMMEGFNGMKLIRSFGRESYEQERFDQSLKRVNSALMKVQTVQAVPASLSEVLAVAVLVLILIVTLQTKDQSNFPALLTFIFILYRLQPAIKQLDSARVNLNSLMGSVENVMSFLKRSDKPYIRSGAIQFKGIREAISFESVSFKYSHGDEYSIQNITLSIPRGKTTAIVGPSGAGKSTLISLICRFYDVTEGEIYVDKCPLRDLALESWRNRIAIVSQDVHVFSTTIRENIAYGRLDATDDEIVTAAKYANAHEFISQFPQGYDTMVGDRGMKLSGGQRQRIALARAIIRDPEILILDEATNALDSVSEHLIQEAINTLSQNRTVIVIAHRLSTIEQADQIVVVEQGRVVERGNLQELLQLKGLFAKLYYLQNREAQA